MEDAERRRDVRAQVSLSAQILRIGVEEQIEVLNASFRGLFIRTYGAPPPTSQLLKLRIELPTRPIQLHAVPVRIVADAHGNPCVGLRFFALNGEDKRVWESFIMSLLAGRKMAA
jgi:hypothetical protein